MNRPLSDEELARILAELSSSEDEDCDIEAGIGEEEGDISDQQSIHSEHLSSSEIDLSDDAESSSDEEGIPENSFYGKNRFQWAKCAPHSSRIRRHNLVQERAGLRGPASTKDHMTPLESWKLLFTDNIIDSIVYYTNLKLEAKYSSALLRPYYAKNLDSDEFRAYFGLLLFTSIFKSNHEDVRSLWASDYTGRDVFRATMGLNRFLFIHYNVTFDDINTRELRKSTDKLALIREIFEKFIENCAANYSCSEYLCVDEMLVKFRGRCSFRMFIKSKPGKYGLKIQCICDAKTHYLYNAFVYTGKSLVNQGNPNPTLSVPTKDVLKLAEPFYGTNRNITGDSWFSSVELADKLLQNGLTYVGTMRKNKREIPREFLPNKNRLVGTSLFGFVQDKTLVSHVPKKNKSVILLSSMHHEEAVDEISNKPEIIEFYNSTKGGVDALDLKCSNYSCSRRTRRWPNAIFGAIVNISVANGYVIWMASNPDKKGSRRKYIKATAKELIQPYICKRLDSTPRLTKEIQSIMCKVVGRDPTVLDEAGPSAPKMKRRCYICPRSKDKKSTIVCKTCKKTICKPHSMSVIYCLPCEPKDP